MLPDVPTVTTWLVSRYSGAITPHFAIFATLRYAACITGLRYFSPCAAIHASALPYAAAAMML